MKKTISMLALFVALTAGTANAQYNTSRNRDAIGRNEPGVYADNSGEYHWQTVERRVWVPESRTSGIFGIGGRIIPGHYEMRTDRVKVYHNQYRNSNQYGQYGQNQPGWVGKHPHGMPPGQRKKLDQQRDNRNGRYDQNYGNGTIKQKNGRYDRENDRY